MADDNRIASILNQSTPSPAPGPSPSPPATPQGSGEGEVRFNPDSIQALGKRIEGEVGDLIKQARYKLNGTPRDVQSGSFTTFAYPLAVAYTEAISFADQDLISKAKAVIDFNDRLHKTADNQNRAETGSTTGN